ncbi:hypothetical protein MMC27_004001 [Xylographa pallens]|nr:hypothetical protein [Xylographa pallens]
MGAGLAAKIAVAHLTELVRPGGWIQLIEAENLIGEEDGPAMHDFLKLMKDVFTAMGAKVTMARHVRNWLEGIVNVQERMCIWEQRMQTLALPSGPPSLSEVELETLVSRLKAELSTRGANYPLRVIWGRKSQ